jgi:hypothetical protein
MEIQDGEIDAYGNVCQAGCLEDLGIFEEIVGRYDMN